MQQVDPPSATLPPAERLRIVVLGYVIRGPLGGLAWHHLQYVVGLARLGHDVLFVEDSDDYPSCVHLNRDAVDTDPSEGLRFADDAFRRLGVAEKFAYHDVHASRWLGPAAERAERFCRAADVVLNVSAVNPRRPWWAESPIRILIDTDPVFVQIRHLHDDGARSLAEAHNAFFTFGEKFGDADCGIPDDGFPWQRTRQPVVLDAWPVEPLSCDHPFTTVMQWGSYQEREHDGQVYRMKSASFEPFFDLPGRTDASLMLAIGGAARPPTERLLASGWEVRDSLEINRDPWAYQRFIRDSLGEFSVAKHGYVASRSGWFSERSANYLASGRPVVVEDTGFSDRLPTGEGLIAIRSPEEAAAALESIRAEPQRHADAARAIAETHFDASVVLSELLRRSFEVVR